MLLFTIFKWFQFEAVAQPSQFKELDWAGRLTSNDNWLLEVGVTISKSVVLEGVQ